MTKSAEDQPIGSSQEADGDKEARRKILIGEAVLAKVDRLSEAFDQSKDDDIHAGWYSATWRCGRCT